MDQYKSFTDIKHWLPTIFRAVHDGLLDLTKPEQLTPLAINKCVQVFTMGIGGPAVPQLLSAALALKKTFELENNPRYELPMWLISLPSIVGLFSLYGSRFGPYASTHTVQLRSDLKDKLTKGGLNIPVGGRMYLSKEFWGLFFKELPASVVAQGLLHFRLGKLSREDARSAELLRKHEAKIKEHQKPHVLEAGEAGPPPVAGRIPVV
jgi:hypothetical protein